MLVCLCEYVCVCVCVCVLLELVDSVLYARMNKHKGLSGCTAQILSPNIEYKSVSHLVSGYRVSQISFLEVALGNEECQHLDITEWYY